MKKQFYIAVSMLAIVGLVSVFSESSVARSVPRITSSLVFPTNSRTPGIGHVVRHSFKLQVPSEGSALSQLTLTVPKGLRIPRSVTVSNASSQAMQTDVLVNNRQITLTFPQPVLPGTLLEISLNDVQIASRTNAWIYPVAAKLVGFSSEIPIGVAQFRTGY